MQARRSGGADSGHCRASRADAGDESLKEAYFTYFRNSGLRFSFKALTPSRDSSVS